MFYKINKLFLKIASFNKFILIKILFISILLFYSKSAFSKDINIEKNLAYKYCDSIERNLFKGLDNERILKYEYFFNMANKKDIKDQIDNLKNFTSEVESICSYKLNNVEVEDFRELLKTFLLNK
tara:strand:- start:127 stop:501 length:375 start_codon:yes stop_codon:yes gene_type:complete